MSHLPSEMHFEITLEQSGFEGHEATAQLPSKLEPELRPGRQLMFLHLIGAVKFLHAFYEFNRI